MLDYLSSLDPQNIDWVLAYTSTQTLDERYILELDNKLKVPLTLTIDVDSLNKETYEKLRVNGSFDRLMRNIQTLKQCKNIKIDFTFLQLEENKGEEEAYMKFANENKTGYNSYIKKYYEINTDILKR